MRSCRAPFSSAARRAAVAVLFVWLCVAPAAVGKSTDEYLEELKQLLPMQKREAVLIRYQQIAMGESQELDLGFCELTAVPVDVLCHLEGKLESLGLGNNLLSEFPDEMCRCLGATLKKLDLSDNLLDEVPDKFDQFKVLSWLRLSNNRFKIFPYSVYSMRKLRRLVLSGNMISAIDRDIAFLEDLKVLNLGNNNITHLPEEVCELSKARVGFYGNPLESPPLKVAIKGIREVKKWFDKQAQREEIAAEVEATNEVLDLLNESEGDAPAPQEQSRTVGAWTSYWSAKDDQWYWHNSRTGESRWAPPGPRAGPPPESPGEEDEEDGDELFSLLKDPKTTMLGEEVKEDEEV